MKNILLIGSIVLGIVLLIVAAVYLINPANHLPTFFPGYSATLVKHHLTHGVAAGILGIGCFVFGWFQTGKKSSSTKE